MSIVNHKNNDNRSQLLNMVDIYSFLIYYYSEKKGVDVLVEQAPQLTDNVYIVELDDKRLGILINKKVYLENNVIETNLTKINKIWDNKLFHCSLNLYKDFYNTIYQKSKFDWSNVPIDTKIVVVKTTFFGKQIRERCYFAGYKDGYVYYFANQQTSFTTNKKHHVCENNAIIFKEK